MLKTLRVGVVGHGFMGKVHGHAYRAMRFYFDPLPARIVLAGVATATESSWRRAVDEWGYEYGTTDFRALCARDDIDIINCCTPNDSHKEVLLTALAHGKHVYMDKPLCLNLAEARAMADCARAHPECITQMTFNYRFIPALLRAKALIDSGRLGRLYSVRTCFLHMGYGDPNRPMSWRTDAARSGRGGALFDLGSHVVDLTRWLAGEFSEVAELSKTFVTERPLPGDSSRRAPVLVDDISILSFRLACGAVGTLEASRVATGAQDDLRFEAHGELGAVRFNLMQPNFLEFFDATAAGGAYGGERGYTALETACQYPKPAALPGPRSVIGWERFHVQCMHNFVTHVVEGTPAEPDVVDGARTQAVLEAAIASRDAQGAWVPVEAV